MSGLHVFDGTASRSAASIAIAGAVSSGIFFATTNELSTWRNRRTNGPYRNSTDKNHGGTEGPPGWAQIVAEKDALIAGTTLWSGPADLDADGSILFSGSSTANDPPSTARKDANRAASAALYAVVENDNAVRTAVKNYVVAQLNPVAYPRLDFANSTLWPTTKDTDLNPGFVIANWLGSFTFAIDLIGIDQFTAAELETVCGVLYHASRVMAGMVHVSLSSVLGVDRLSEIWSVGAAETNTWIPYSGGPAYNKQGRFVNNRRASMATLPGVCGHWLDSIGYVSPGPMTLADMRNHGRVYFKEQIRYGLYPPSADPGGVAGFTTDFHRASSTSPDSGLSYASGMISAMGSIADAAARFGDPSLFTYTTRDGAYHSACQATDPDKSLEQAMLTLARYYNQTYNKLDPSGTTRIDGRSAPLVRDIEVMVRSNLHYQNTELRDTYKRVLAGTAVYPASPQATGAATSPYRVDNGIYPDGMFLWGDLEGVLNPF